MSVATGVRLGPYEITGKLGQGGMGEVYRATDPRLRREVAIKVLPEGFTADRERLARFEREAQLLAQLNHEHIAHIYGLETFGDTRALVMELVQGPTLAERIASGPLPLDEALPIARQIAEALEVAHERGIVHRDLKPQNVKLTADDSVKVLDFGLAKAVDAASGSGAPLQDSPTLTVGATVQGVVLGTASYMSPEQARGKAVDKRADIWAFGCVLYEMLTGRRAFEGETVSDVVAAVLRHDVAWSALPAATPPAVTRLLHRCLERDPKLRLRDIGEARIALAASPGAPEQAVASPVAPARAHSGLAWGAILAGLALIALAATAAFLVGRGRGTTESPTLEFTQKTYGAQAIFNARFSPDGQTIVFSAAAVGSVPEMFAVQGTYPEPRRLGLPNTHLLAVSSRGDLAVLTDPHFESQRVFTGTLGIVPLGGQAVRAVLDGVREADWSPDGSRLAIVRTVERVDRLEYPAGTVLYRTAGYLSDLRVDPRGQRIAFFDHPLKWDDRGSVVVVDVAGKATTLATGFQSLEGLAWSAPEAVSFTGTRTGGYNIGTVYTVDLRGRERVVLTTPVRLVLLDARADGNWIFSRESPRNELWAQLAGAATPVELSWLDTDSTPLLSADGRKLLFSEQADVFGANYAVCLRGTDGSPPVVLGEGQAMALSPDGRWAVAVVFTSPPRVVLYPTGPGERRVLDSSGLQSIHRAEWFPDGRSILVLGNEAGHALRMYQLAVGGGPPRAVTPEVVGGRGPFGQYLAPDGRSVIAQESGGGSFVQLALDGGAARPVLGLRPGDSILRWAPDGGSVLVARQGIPMDVERLDLRSGVRTPFVHMTPADPSGVLEAMTTSASADERSFAYVLARVRSVLFTASPKK